MESRRGIRAALVVAPIDGEQWETFSLNGITYIGSGLLILDLATPPASPLLQNDPGVPLTEDQKREIVRVLSSSLPS